MQKRTLKLNTFQDFLRQYCSKEWIELASSQMSVKRFSKEQRIFTQGEKVDGVYYINSGMVKVVTTIDKANERILRLSNVGSLVGHRGLSSQYYPVSAIALVDAELTFIPLKVFMNLVKTNPDFSMYLIHFISEELKETEERMKSMIHAEVITRIAFIICMLIDAFGFKEDKKAALKFCLTRTDIANIAGTTYESVIRNLAHLESKKLIKLDGKGIIITKEAELRKLAGLKKQTRL